MGRGRGTDRKRGRADGLRVMSVISACVLLAVSGVNGCAPVISKEVMQEVDEGISFQEMQQRPEVYQGKTTVLGGDIIQTENYPNKTLLVVLHRPLDSRQRPETEGTSLGRFIVRVPGFLDPAIYQAGRLITVAGEVAGKETRTLGEVSYTYPVIEKRELHLWPREGSGSSGSIPVHFGIGIGIGL